jgi:hypothetical protein
MVMPQSFKNAAINRTNEPVFIPIKSGDVILHMETYH